MHTVINKKRNPLKEFLGMGFIVLITSFILVAFVKEEKPQEKTYKFEMTLDQINSTIYCLQQSNAPAVTTNAIISLISSQVNPVLQAEQKKIQDSLDKAKKPKQ